MHKAAATKLAKFIISKGPSTAAEYLEKLRKIVAAKEAERAAAKAQAMAKVPKVTAPKPRARRRRKGQALYGMPTGHGTAAFQFGD